MSSPRAISELKMWPLYQYADHEPAPSSLVESIGPRSKNAISLGCAGSVQSNTETPPWYQRLHHDVAPGHRDQRAVVRDAVLLRRLRRRHLVVAVGT